MDGEPVVVRLAPAEVAPVARAVSSGLASLAASGRRPAEVTWDAVGRGPQGWQLHIDRLDLVTGPVSRDDVRDWAAALLARCPAETPALLLRVLRACKAGRSEDRPDAAELARLVAAATQPPRQRDRRLPWRWLGLIVLVALGLPAAWAAGQAMRPGLPQPSSPETAFPRPASTAPPTASSRSAPSRASDPLRAPSRRAVHATTDPEWTVVLAALDRGRAAWWTDPESADLGAVDVPGSAAWRADRAVVSRLQDAGVRAEGGRALVESVRRVERGHDWVLLAVVDRRAAYRLVDLDGRVREQVAARGPIAWHVRLVQVERNWRVQRVERVSSRALAASPSAPQGRPPAPARTSGAPR